MSVFKRTNQYYNKYGAEDILAHNLAAWIEYGLLELGAYTPITFLSPTSGYTDLKKSFDREYGGDGRVYEGFGPSWAWQTGVAAPSGLSSIFRPSGVWVDGTFYGPGHGTYGHQVDYRNGRIIFDTAVTTGTVQCEYVMNDVGVGFSDDQEYQRLVSDYADRFADIGTTSPSGLSANRKSERVWLPSVFVNVNGLNSTRGLQLGGGEINTVSTSCHIFAERPYDRSSLMNIIQDEQAKVLSLYDLNDDTLPFNYDGSLISSPVEYPTLAVKTNENFWTFAYIKSAKTGTKMNLGGSYYAIVEQEIELDRFLSTF